jgi:hypothetical protein
MKHIFRSILALKSYNKTSPPVQAEMLPQRKREEMQGNSACVSLSRDGD